jgi:hypothetical protein
MTAQPVMDGERLHGTRARYVMGPGPGQGPGCRCAPCRAANRAAENQRTKLIAYGRWQPYVDAGPAREHVRQLAARGIGWKQAAMLAGVPTGAMSKLLYGGPGGRPPSQRVRPGTAAAILAVARTGETSARVRSCRPRAPTGGSRHWWRPGGARRRSAAGSA